MPRHKRRSNHGHNEGESRGSSKEDRPWWKKLLTTPALILTTVLTTAVSWGATQFLSRTRDSIQAEQPLAIHVEENPASIPAFSDLPITAIIPSDVSTAGSPGAGCAGFREWVKANRGIDAGTSRLQIVIQGKVAEPILLSELRAKVIEVSRPMSGIAVTCPTAGEVNYRPINIDLDQTPPRVTYMWGQKEFGFTVAENETEAFNIEVSTTTSHFKWILELEAIVKGKRQTIYIGDPLSPFETSPYQSTAGWEWDYEDTWYNTAPEEGFPSSVPVMAPLVPLQPL